MTRMAAYEAGSGKKDEAVCSFFRNDFIGFWMLKTWIAVTIAYGTLAGVYVLYRMDALTDRMYSMEFGGLWELGKKFLILYAVLCAVYLAAAYVHAHLIYRRAYRSRVQFAKLLSEIDGSEEEEV